MFCILEFFLYNYKRIYVVFKGLYLKDKFIITISDIHGSKQYTVSQFLKVIISWIIIVVVIAFAIGSMVLNYLSNNVDKLQKEKKELKKQIEISTQTLEAISEQLAEAENLIGLNLAKEKEKEENKKREEQKKSKELKKKKEESLDKDSLSKEEFLFLSKLIPNGKPLQYKRISTRFGFRRHPITKRKEFHPANDLTADVGTPIYAPANGVVVYAGKKRFYGNFLLIRHSLGFATAYGHLHRIGVKSGEYVKKGDLVALSGNSGRSTGPHLHYEVRYLSKWLDPVPFMKGWNYDKYKEVFEKNQQVDWKGLIKSLRGEINLIKNKGE